jgi:hypothetical protein
MGAVYVRVPAMDQPEPRRWKGVVALFVLLNVAIVIAAIVLGHDRPPRRSHRVDGYVSQGEPIPAAEQVPGVPFLRRQEGVTYYRPEAVPKAVVEKLRLLGELRLVLRQMGTEPENDPRNDVGITLRVNWVDAESVLATKLGLKPGDEILSVDGNPLPETLSDGDDLHEKLRALDHLAIKVRRNGEPSVLTVYAQ